MLSNKQIKIIKYIKKNPKLSDVLKYFNLTDEAELISLFPNPNSIRFDSDSYINLDTNISVSPDILAEFDEHNRSTLRFWLPLTGSVIAFFRPELFAFAKWAIELCSKK